MNKIPNTTFSVFLLLAAAGFLLFTAVPSKVRAVDGRGMPMSESRFQISAFSVETPVREQPVRGPGYGAYIVDSRSGDVWLASGASALKKVGTLGP